MRRIVVTEFVSLDGVMEEPRWTFQFNRGPKGDQFKTDELFAAGAMLLGRVTYQGFAQAWPVMEEGKTDYGVRMNTMPRYVVSQTLDDADATWGPTTVIRGDVPAELAKLKEQEGGDLLVHGSNQLAQTLIAGDLVDELRLMVFPIILGTGKRVFPDSLSAPATLTLVEADTASDGVLLLTYRRAPADRPAGSQI
jgi:dihydrofolate reductase